MTDSWKTDGDCDKCRRQSYCSKLCRPRQETNQRMMQQKVAELMNRVSEKNGLQYPNTN